MRIIEIYDSVLDVDYWAKWLAVDKDGDICFYAERPKLDIDEFIIHDGSNNEKWEYAYDIDGEKVETERYENDEWKNSLIPIDDSNIITIPNIEKL